MMIKLKRKLIFQINNKNKKANFYHHQLLINKNYLTKRICVLAV